MPTLRGLLDTLEDFVKDDLRYVELQVKPKFYPDDDTKMNGERRSFKVYQQRMPSASDADEEVPYILLQIVNGSDKRDGRNDKKKNVTTVRWIITIYNEDPQDGALELVEIVDKLRIDLQNKGKVGNYKLQEPFEYLFYPDDTIPYHLAELSTDWDIQTIEPEKPDYLRL